MSKFLFLALYLMSFSTFGASEAEEAIILNQELQYLQDSVNLVQAISLKTSESASRNRALNEPVIKNKTSLEETYFGNQIEEDSVTTRSAGQKKRGL
jgi:hypothetical protein